MPNSDNVTNVRPNIAGAVWVGDIDEVTLPVTAIATLDTDFTSFGYISDDGIARTINRSTASIKDMNGDEVMVVTSEHSLEYQFKPLELNAVTCKAMFGDSNVTTGTDGEVTGIKIKNDELQNKAFIFELVLRDMRKMRVVIPNGKITNIADANYKSDDALASMLTLSAMPDDSGVKAYIYFGAAA